MLELILGHPGYSGHPRKSLEIPEIPRNPNTPRPPNRRLPNRRKSKIVEPIFAQKVLDNTCFDFCYQIPKRKNFKILNFKIIFP